MVVFGELDREAYTFCWICTVMQGRSKVTVKVTNILCEVQTSRALKETKKLKHCLKFKEIIYYLCLKKCTKYL